MRYFLNALVLTSLIAASVPSASSAAPQPAVVPTQQTVTLAVQNMDCPVCPYTVRKALENVPGVAMAVVDFNAKTATVTFDPTRADVAALTKATTDAGYPSTVKK